MKEELIKIIGDLKKDGVLGAAFVKKNGNILATELPKLVNDETFAIMMATMMGAAHTVNTGLELGDINNISVNSHRGKIVIISINEDVFLASIIDHSYKVDDFVSKVKTLCQDLNEYY